MMIINNIQNWKSTNHANFFLLFLFMYTFAINNKIYILLIYFFLCKKKNSPYSSLHFVFLLSFFFFINNIRTCIVYWNIEERNKKSSNINTINKSFDLCNTVSTCIQIIFFYIINIYNLKQISFFIYNLNQLIINWLL